MVWVDDLVSGYSLLHARVLASTVWILTFLTCTRLDCHSQHPYASYLFGGDGMSMYHTHSNLDWHNKLCNNMQLLSQYITLSNGGLPYAPRSLPLYRHLSHAYNVMQTITGLCFMTF